MEDISREDAIKGLNTVVLASMMARENKPFPLGMTFDEINECIKKAISDMDKLDRYETKLTNAYGKCDTLLDVVVDGLVKQAEEHIIGQPRKARLLTDEDVDLWEQAKSDRKKLEKIEHIVCDIGECDELEDTIIEKVEKHCEYYLGDCNMCMIQRIEQIIEGE